MSNSLVIVALPAEDEYVQKISSEKVPHLTLMYLGEITDDNNATRMAEFVEHALKIHGHGPFYLDVDYRGELGDTKADVLFFSEGWEAKWIKTLRGQLLKQADIRLAYESVDQFPDWVPHLTLGYPDTPAKKLDDDYKIYGVSFDRIAVWTGNYEGPEFRLKWPERDYEETSLAMSSTNEARVAAGMSTVDDILHYGVKGMKWGVRKEQLLSGAKKVGKGVGGAVKIAGDIQFENMAEDGRARAEIQTRAGAAFRRTDLPALKAKPEYEKAKKTTHRLRHPKDPLTKQYRKEAKEAYIKRLEDAANSMENFSGTREYTIRERGWELPAQGGALPTGKHFWDVSTREKIRHAADAFEGTTTLEVVMDSDGFITDLIPQETEMAQDGLHDADALAHFRATGIEFLEHYGVKGMKWGVRRESHPVTPSATSRVPHGARRRTRIQTEGGENHPASSDAIKVAQARVKLQKSGTAALSNQELKEVADRMRLEEQVTQMTRSKGNKFVRQLLGNQGKQAANQIVRNEIDDRLFKKRK